METNREGHRTLVNVSSDADRPRSFLDLPPFSAQRSRIPDFSFGFQYKGKGKPVFIKSRIDYLFL